MIDSRRTRSNGTFTSKIDALTCGAISNGATSFSVLLQVLPSVYPTELLASLSLPEMEDADLQK